MISSSAFKSCVFSALSAILLTIAGAGAAQATTVLMLNDEDLIVSSRAIVQGRVINVESRYDSDQGVVYTYVTVRVKSVLKGRLAVQEIVLRQLGGRTAELEQIIYGAPEFKIGERTLLYLNTADDGALRVAHLFMGKFQILRDSAAGRQYVRRSISEVLKLDDAGRGEITNGMELDAYIAKIRATLAARADRAAEYERLNQGRPLLAAPSEYTQTLISGVIKPQFGFLGSGFRWFEADSGAPIMYRINMQNAPTANGSFAEFISSLAAWTNVPTASIVLQSAGSTNLCGFRNDGVTTISFNDCLNQIDDPVNGRGVLAIGGASAVTNEAKTVSGKSFNRILEGDVAFNNGFGSFLGVSSNTAEVMTHEIGHSIGMGHSSENQNESNFTFKDATMYFQVHADGRAASLRADDNAGVSFIYPDASSANDFTLSASPTVQSVIPGAAANFTISAQAVGLFTNTINLSAAFSPSAGITGQFSSTTLSPGGSVNLTVNISPTAASNAVTATITGSSNQLVRTASIQLNVVDFRLIATPTQQSISPGGSTSITISAQSLGGFTQSIDLSAAVSPSDAAFTTLLSTTNIRPGGAPAVLTVNTEAGVSTAPFTVIVTGTSGQLARTVAITVNIAEFSLSFSPPVQIAAPGSAVSFIITATALGDFSQTVLLDVTTSPPNIISTNLSSTTIRTGGSVTLNASVGQNPSAKSFTIMVTGRSGQIVRTAAAVLSLADFALEAAPAQQSINPGAAAIFTISSRDLGGFSQPINLSAAVSQSGGSITPEFSAQTITAGGISMLTLRTSPTTPTSSFTITVNGRAGQLTRTTTITLNVTAPVGDFTLSATPAAQTIMRTASASVVVAVQGIGGFAQPVALSAVVTPTDGTVVAAFSSNTATAGSNIVLTINTSDSNTAARNAVYTVTIIGASGALARSAATVLTVIAGPRIDSAVFDGNKTLTLNGIRFGSGARVLINNIDKSNRVKNASDASLTLRGKAKKLGLASGQNSVQVIDSNGIASNSFIFNF